MKPIKPQSPFLVVLICAVDNIYTRPSDTWEWYEQQITAMVPFMTPNTVACVMENMQRERKYAERKLAIIKGRPMAEEME